MTTRLWVLIRKRLGNVKVIKIWAKIPSILCLLQLLKLSSKDSTRNPFSNYKSRFINLEWKFRTSEIRDKHLRPLILSRSLSQSLSRFLFFIFFVLFLLLRHDVEEGLFLIYKVWMGRCLNKQWEEDLPLKMKDQQNRK